MRSRARDAIYYIIQNACHIPVISIMGGCFVCVCGPVYTRNGAMWRTTSIFFHIYDAVVQRDHRVCAWRLRLELGEERVYAEYIYKDTNLRPMYNYYHYRSWSLYINIVNLVAVVRVLSRSLDLIVQIDTFRATETMNSRADHEDLQVYKIAISP